MQFKTGYVRRPEAIREFIRTTSKPFLAQHNKEIRGSAENVQVRLVKALEQVTGQPFENHEQEIGDCVSHGGTLAVDLLCAIEIVAGEREEWRGKFSTEVSYGLSRVEIGGGKIRGDGSTGAWMAKALTQYGVILRGKHGNHDLSKYRPDLAKLWGRNGVPDELEPTVRDHPVAESPIVTSAQEAADSIANGNPIFVCSDRGFSSRTDADGFLSPRGTWFHCMAVIGVDTKSDRKGFEIAQSWPESWIGGPAHKLGTVKSGFWADWDVVDRMLRQGDSYAVAGFKGFPRRVLDYVLL